MSDVVLFNEGDLKRVEQSDKRMVCLRCAGIFDQSQASMITGKPSCPCCYRENIVELKEYD